VPLIVGVLCTRKYSDQSSTVVNKCQQIKPGARRRTDIKTFLMMAAFACIASKQAKNNTRLYIALRVYCYCLKQSIFLLLKLRHFAKRRNVRMAHRRLLTPFQGALIHLLLIGIPLRFGFPVVFERIWRGEMKSPCFMYEQYSQNGRCLTLERFLLKDYVHRFLLWYTLALFAAWTIRRTGGDSNNLGLRRLNRVLVVVTVLNVFGLAYLQHFGPATFTSSYISLVVFNSLLAIAISVYVCQPMSILTSKKPAKWSLPGTALFGGLVS
jgi:hypothetical protein